MLFNLIISNNSLLIYEQVPSALEFLRYYMSIICKYTQESTDNNLGLFCDIIILADLGRGGGQTGLSLSNVSIKCLPPLLYVSLLCSS